MKIREDKLTETVGQMAAEKCAEEVSYTTKHLGRISGISRDQLGRWDRDRVLTPARRGIGNCQRAYTRDQALGIMALGELRRHNVSERRIRAAAAVLPIIAAHRYLVFDGRMLYARATAEEVVELLGKMTQGGRVLRLAPLAERLVL